MSTHAFKHRVPLPATFACYTKLVGRWKVMPSVVDDLKSLWKAFHEDLDQDVEIFGQETNQNGDS
jgi:hypothetical protein